MHAYKETTQDLMGEKQCLLQIIPEKLIINRERIKYSGHALVLENN